MGSGGFINIHTDMRGGCLVSAAIVAPAVLSPSEKRERGSAPRRRSGGRAIGAAPGDRRWCDCWRPLGLGAGPWSAINCKDRTIDRSTNSDKSTQSGGDERQRRELERQRSKENISPEAATQSAVKRLNDKRTRLRGQKASVSRKGTEELFMATVYRWSPLGWSYHWALS